MHAVLGGGQGLHIALLVHAVGIQTAALGVDGGDKLRLALVLKAAQSVEGPVDDAGGAALAVAAVGAGGHAHAVVDAAAPEHVLQGDGVVVDVKAGEQALHIGNELCVLGAAPELRLRLAELGGVFTVADRLPRVFEVGTETGIIFTLGVIGVGVIQCIAETAVHGIVGLLQPVHKGRHRALHEHIQSVGGAAAVLIHGGDQAGIGAVPRFVVLAQRTELRVAPRLAGGQQYRGDAAHQHDRRQYQCHSPFCPFHKHTPCLISKLYGNSGGGKSPSADLHNNIHV